MHKFDSWCQSYKTYFILVDIFLSKHETIALPAWMVRGAHCTPIGQNIMETYAGKQLSQAITDV